MTASLRMVPILIGLDNDYKRCWLFSPSVLTKLYGFSSFSFPSFFSCTEFPKSCRPAGIRLMSSQPHRMLFINDGKFPSPAPKEFYERPKAVRETVIKK